MMNETMFRCRPGNYRSSSYSSSSDVNPHFFTVVLQNTLRDNRLLIPTKFVKKYGGTMSNPVFVKVPSGSEWKMELRKCDGRVCLQRGWPEFVKHYSIALGHILVFRYEGHSRFHTFIFDTTTVEIDYPLIPAHSNERNGVLIKDDDFVEILEDFTPYPRKRKSSPSPCSQPQKKFRTSPIQKTEIKGTQSNEKILKNSMGNNGVLCHLKSMRGKIQASVREDDGDKSTMPRWRKSEIENSTCEVVIKPSHVGKYHDMRFPRKFANEIFKNGSRDAVLILSDGVTWPVKFQRRSRLKRHRYARFERLGWEKFVRENNLKVGDTCIFELINGNKISLKVSILKSHPSHVGDQDRTKSLKPKRNVKAKTESGCTSKHQEKTEVGLGKLWHGQVTCVPQISGDSRATEAASRFSSKNPFFVKSVTSSGLCTQRVPIDFAKCYFEKKTQTVTMQTGKNSWSVTMVFNSPKSYLFSGGWAQFARENSLRPGDVCVFELVKKNDIVLKVTNYKK